MSNVICQMSNVNKVNILSERTSGVPPVIFVKELLVETGRHIGEKQTEISDPIRKYKFTSEFDP